MIFPKFENMKIIDNIREKYDPNVNKVAPHITLVFPFDSQLTKEELVEHLRNALKDAAPFNLTMGDILKVDVTSGKYLFLGVKEGTEEIKNIFNKLYKGILEGFKSDLLKKVEFMPHMTIGVFNDKESLNKAYEETKGLDKIFKGRIDKISVEIIKEDEDSIIEFELEL